MKFIKADREEFSFQIEPRELQALFRALELYPLVPATHHKLCKNDERSEDQKLLEEALSEQRAKNKTNALAMLEARSRFQENQDGFLFSLKNHEMEWLLQVLNDVRVGSWLLLGSPTSATDSLALVTPENAPYFWAKEITGYFQMVLLQAMHHDLYPPAGNDAESK